MATNCRACTSTNGQGNIKKRLIVCCDGTFSGVDKGTKDYSSNVARLSRVISRVGATKDEEIPQVVYYQSGVGTGSLTYIDKKRQGTYSDPIDIEPFGGSLAENVCEAYNYVANNWGPGDEIFIFGFSRGAYTARSLAGFITEVGLLTPLLMDHFYDVYEAYRNRGNLSFAETEWAKQRLRPGELGTVPTLQDAKPYDYGSRIEYLRLVSHSHVTIKVVGVWDTVGSLQVTNWFGEVGGDSYGHSTKLNPKIENAFHALAIDETRGNFPPTLWCLDSSCIGPDPKKPIVNLKQCWFPGYHSDVGGHSEGSIDTNSVDEIAFAWMCDQLHGLLQLSGTALQKYILFRLSDRNFDTSDKEIRDLSAAWRKISWSDGTLVDTNSWTSGWWIGSALSTGKGSYKRVPGQTEAYTMVDETKVPIPYENFCEEVHPSVFHRVQKFETAKKGERYMPAPFQGSEWKHLKAENGERARWVKTLGNGKKVILREYCIPKNEELAKGYTKVAKYDHWQGSLERTFAPKDILQAQDRI
ncbi:peptidoglycan binding domain-containing protein [Mariannaea sp. PMI_226]|nr:peptidoglycan binding domain-containing protein [Mariannaea sp. PMI_226]